MKAQAKLREIGMKIINDKKAEIVAQGHGHVEKGSEEVQGRDLLTVLIRANMAEDLPEAQRLSDDEMLAQVPTSVSTFLSRSATDDRRIIQLYDCRARDDEHCDDMVSLRSDTGSRCTDEAPGRTA